MKIPQDSFYSKFSHVEVGRYSSAKNTMFRESTGLIPWSEIREYAAKHNNTGIYHSIRRYDPGDGLQGVSLATLHFDIDNKEDPGQSLEDTRKIYDYLVEVAKIPEESIHVFFSGMKGCHIVVEPMTIRMGLISENTAIVFKMIAQEIHESIHVPSLDFAVYDARRMWRLEGSRHQNTGLYKIHCKDLLLNDAGIEQIQKAAEVEPEEYEYPDPVFSSSAAIFFAEKVATYEAKLKEREQDKLNSFLKSGHAKSSFDDNALRQFTPGELKDGCPAVDELIEKAKKTQYLDHYERLFLCSLLTYTPDAIEYFQKILAYLEDYNFEISNLHIQDWIMRRENEIGGRPYSCSKAQEVGINCSGCSKLTPKKYETSLGLEHIAEPSPVRFAYKYHS